jgi:hypothetical protein
MKLFFKHIAGRVTDMDFYYSPVYAHFEQHEIAEAVNTGWLINEWAAYEPRRWFQSRIVRLDLKDWTMSKSDMKRIEETPVAVSKTSLSIANIKEMQEVFEKYIKHKKFDAPLDWMIMLEPMDIDKKIIINFRLNGKMIGWVLCRIYEEASTLCSLQFAWDYDDPRLELGKLSQLYEMITCKSLGLRYQNLCSGYESSSFWKSRLPGFEWWTGEKWSNNKHQFITLCTNDDAVKTINDCILSERVYDLTT